MHSAWSKLSNDGILHEPILDILWRDYEGKDQALRPYLLEMMIKFGLMVQLRNRTFLVPSLLKPKALSRPSPSAPQHCFYICFVTDRDVLDQSSVRVGYMRQKGFLPHGLYARLLGKCVTWSECTHGMVPEFSKTRARLSIGEDIFELEEMLDLNIIKVCHLPSAICHLPSRTSHHITPQHTVLSQVSRLVDE